MMFCMQILGGNFYWAWEFYLDLGGFKPFTALLEPPPPPTPTPQSSVYFSLCNFRVGKQELWFTRPKTKHNKQ